MFALKLADKLQTPTPDKTSTKPVQKSNKENCALRYVREPSRVTEPTMGSSLPSLFGSPCSWLIRQTLANPPCTAAYSSQPNGRRQGLTVSG